MENKSVVFFNFYHKKCKIGSEWLLEDTIELRTDDEVAEGKFHSIIYKI